MTPAATFKLLSDPTRLHILRLLMNKRDEMCVAEIADAVGITHSAASHQLAGLEARGIVTSHRMGQTMCYNLTNGNTTNHIKKLMLLATK